MSGIMGIIGVLLTGVGLGIGFYFASKFLGRGRGMSA